MRINPTEITGVLVVITGYYAYATQGLLRAAQAERQDRLERERSEHARLVGGYITIDADFGGVTPS